MTNIKKYAKRNAKAIMEMIELHLDEEMEYPEGVTVPEVLEIERQTVNRLLAMLKQGTIAD